MRVSAAPLAILAAEIRAMFLPHGVISDDFTPRKWVFDPKSLTDFFERCRGIVYDTPPPDKRGMDNCGDRIALATPTAKLIMIDAEKGDPCAGFGDDGAVDLTADIGDYDPAFYTVTSRPLIRASAAGMWRPARISSTPRRRITVSNSALRKCAVMC